MYQLTANNFIIRMSDRASIPADPTIPEYANYLDWVKDGNTPTPYAPPALTNDDFVLATQQRLDALAASWNYDSMLSLVTYIDSSIPRFKAEAAAGRDFRDATWSTVVNIQSEVASGSLPAPVTLENYLALLPALPSRPV